MIRFSIITCTYQAASELPKTLESVLHQRYRHVEHIIIDGASTDGTKDIVERYIQANDDNEDCMHRVVEHIAGCVGEGEAHPGVLYGDTVIVDDTGRFLRRRRLSPPRKLTWRSFRNGMLVCHQAFYVRADIAKSIPYDRHYKYSADVDWCIKVMKKAAQQHMTLRNVNAVIANYLDGGLSVKNHKASLKERFHVMQSHYGLLTTLIFHFWFLIRSVIQK